MAGGLCDGLKQLSKNSVVPGFPQISATRNASQRALKILVFVGCAVGFFWQTSSFLDVFWTYPTVVDVESEFLDRVDLPAVTVCSHNGIKSDAFCRRFPDLCYPNSSLDEFCRMHDALCDPNYDNYGNESYATVTPMDLPPLPRSQYREMGTSVEDIVTGCYVRIRGKLGNYNCTDEFEAVSVFDATGLPNNCYAYNSLWGKTQGARVVDSNEELVFHLKADRVHSGQFYPGTPFAIQMSLHSPYAILNPFQEGFAIDPCSSYYIYPSKQVNRLLPPPYTTACHNYTVAWLARSGKGPVTKQLCLEECILNKSVELAGCVDPYYIAYPNMEPICRRKPNNAMFYYACSDICGPACDQENLKVIVEEHPHMTTEGVHEEDVCFSTIVISFSRMEMLKFSYLPKYEEVSLFSYIGGYLGLWLGISLMALGDVLEAIWVLVKWAIAKRGRNRICSRAWSP